MAPRNRKPTKAERTAHDTFMQTAFPDTWGQAPRFRRPMLSDEQRWQLTNDRRLAGEMTELERYTHYTTDAAW